MVKSKPPDLDQFLSNLARNLANILTGLALADWLTFEFLQGNKTERSKIRVSFVLLSGGGFDITVDQENNQLRLVGGVGAVREWPTALRSSAIPWIIDAISEDIEAQVSEMYDPKKKYLETDEGVFLGSRIATIIELNGLLLRIALGALDSWFDNRARVNKSAANQFVPWRAEFFWKLDSESIVQQIPEWQAGRWNDMRTVFKQAGFDKGYRVSAWDIGRRAGEKLADELFDQVAKEKHLPQLREKEKD